LNYDGLFGIQPNVSDRFGSPSWPGIYMQTVLVSTAAIRAFGGFDQAFEMSMDMDFVFRLGLVTPLCFVNLPLVEVDRAEGRTGLMTLYPLGSIERLHVHTRLLTKWLSLTGDSNPAMRAGLRRRRSSTQSYLANCYLLRRDFTSARNVLTQAIRQSPRPFLIAKYLLTWVAPGALTREIERREAGRSMLY
jgi:hypothetical protein